MPRKISKDKLLEIAFVDKLSLLTISDCALLCGCSRDSIRKAIDKGELRTLKGSNRIPRAALDEYLHSFSVMANNVERMQKVINGVLYGN